MLTKRRHLPRFQRIHVTAMKRIRDNGFEHQQPRQPDQQTALTDLQIRRTMQPLRDRPKTLPAENLPGKHLHDQQHHPRLQLVPGAHQIQNLTLEVLAIQLPRFPTVHAQSLIEQSFEHKRIAGENCCCPATFDNSDKRQIEPNSRARATADVRDFTPNLPKM